MENADSFIKKYFLILNRPLVTAEDKPIEEIKDCSLDLITLSGDLTYDVIRKEISNWVHKLRDGGVMCGTNYNSPDISYAINQFTKDCGVELHIQGRIVQDWWFIKPFGINHLPVYMPPPIATAGGKKLRILALTWPTFDCDKKMMINARGDLVCPAIDGLTNELIKLGHQIVYVNVFAEHIMPSEKDLSCLGMISGLKFHLWKDIKNKDFDIIWHAVKDPTPPAALFHFEKIMKELNPNIPVLNNIESLQDHTKRKYIKVLRKKNVGAIILDDYTDWLDSNGNIDYINKCFPASQGCYVSKDYKAIRLSDRNSQRTNLNKDGITLKYHNTAKYTNFTKPGMRTFFRVPYAAGKCLEGWKYYCPENILCPKSGAAVEKERFNIPQMSAGTISAAMGELGIDIAHIEGVQAGFTVEIFDVNPFPSSAGATLQPMAALMAKRIEQVYSI